MIFLILESLGSTELMFILVMALVFFGPRKLPQLSRTLGKNLASFRRASEDFKRTWEKEVHLEELNMTQLDLDEKLPERSILDTNGSTEPLSSTPSIQPVEDHLAVPRQTEAMPVADEVAPSNSPSTVEPVEPLSKRDWL